MDPYLTLFSSPNHSLLVHDKNSSDILISFANKAKLSLKLVFTYLSIFFLPFNHVSFSETVRVPVLPCMKSVS